jgi:hypothetical protein
VSSRVGISCALHPREFTDSSSAFSFKRREGRKEKGVWFWFFLHFAFFRIFCEECRVCGEMGRWRSPAVAALLLASVAVLAVAAAPDELLTLHAHTAGDTSDGDDSGAGVFTDGKMEKSEVSTTATTTTPWVMRDDEDEAAGALESGGGGSSSSRSSSSGGGEEGEESDEI